MSKALLTVKFTLGNNSATFDAANPKAGKFFVDQIAGEATKDVLNAKFFDLQKLAKSLSANIENSYISAIHYAAKNMIGRQSPQGVDNRKRGVTLNDPDGNGIPIAHWQALSPRTIREQNAMHHTKNSGRFFDQTGALRQQLLGMAKAYVKRTGVVRVIFRQKGRFARITADSKKISIADFSIKLLPSINRNDIPGLISQRSDDFNESLSFEKKLGISAPALRKLRGAGKGDYIIPGTHRPLLQPVFTYWTLNRIPKTIAAALDRSISRNAAVDNSSGQVFIQV